MQSERLATWMPSIESYMAVAEALHDASDMCNGNYVLPLDQCGAREADISDAISILTDLRKAGWRLERDPGETDELPW